MTGRGGGKFIVPSDNPTVTLGLTLGTSSPKLSLDSTEPFYITVTARILTTPDPTRPVTLQADPSPLGGLGNRSFQNFTNTSDPDKFIQIYPRVRNQEHWDGQDLRSSQKFVTVPPSADGTCTVRHEVRRDRIQEANLKSGEHYKVRLTDKCLGTRWWCFGDQDELEGIRLRSYETPLEKKAREDDPEGAREDDEERRQKYGSGPSFMGETPRMLAMVAESEAEFEIA